MKWVAIVLGVAMLALVGGVAAHVTQGDGQSNRRIVPTEASTSVAALVPASLAKRVVSVPDAETVAPPRTQPARAATCNDRSDPTGEDCATAKGDDQAGDNEADEDRNDQAGDNEPDENDTGD